MRDVGTVPTSVDQRNQAPPDERRRIKGRPASAGLKRQKRPSQRALPSTSGVRKGRARPSAVNEGGRKEPSRRRFGEEIWQLPFKSESVPGRLETQPNPLFGH